MPVSIDLAQAGAAGVACCLYCALPAGREELWRGVKSFVLLHAHASLPSLVTRTLHGPMCLAWVGPVQ
jgi:hypothetical protein